MSCRHCVDQAPSHEGGDFALGMGREGAGRVLQSSQVTRAVCEQAPGFLGCRVGAEPFLTVISGKSCPLPVPSRRGTAPDLATATTFLFPILTCILLIQLSCVLVACVIRSSINHTLKYAPNV